MTFTVSKTVSDETLNAIITIESAGRLNAKASTSSALGLGQFLKATWLAVVNKHRPDLLEHRTQEQVLALRTDPQLAVELLARFTEDNQRAIGMNCTGGDLYLAHFLGVGDARDFFRADPNTPASKLVTVDVINANKSILLGKNAGQVRAWAAKRMHESAGRDWVRKYYQPAPIEPDPPPAAEPEPEPSAEDIPDTQDAPPTPLPARPDPVPPVEPAPAPTGPVMPKPNEGFFDWIKRRGKMVASWFSGGALSVGGISWFSDWRIAAVIVGGIIIAGALIGVFYLITTRRRADV